LWQSVRYQSALNKLGWRQAAVTGNVCSDWGKAEDYQGHGTGCPTTHLRNLNPRVHRLIPEVQYFKFCPWLKLRDERHSNFSLNTQVKPAKPRIILFQMQTERQCR
jgi:hypothetical protein